MPAKVTIMCRFEASWSSGPCTQWQVPPLIYSSERANARSRPIQHCHSQTEGCLIEQCWPNRLPKAAKARDSIADVDSNIEEHDRFCHMRIPGYQRSAAGIFSNRIVAQTGVVRKIPEQDSRSSSLSAPGAERQVLIAVALSSGPICRG